MQTQITVPVGDRQVVVHELTLAQIRAYLRGEELKAVAEHQPDAFDSLIEVDGCALPLIYAMSDLAPGDLDAALPSQMGALVAAIKQANPSFFQAEARLSAAQAAYIAQTARGQTPASSSSEASPPSSATATPTLGPTPTPLSSPPSQN